MTKKSDNAGLFIPAGLFGGLGLDFCYLQLLEILERNRSMLAPPRYFKEQGCNNF